MACLILLHESGVAGEFQLKPGLNTIGRDPDNDLSVDHDSVSDHHCELELTATGVVVRDLSSANGTWTDTARIQAGRLDAGQTLLVGEVPFALEGPLRVDARTPGTSAGRMVPSAPAGPVSEAPESVHCPACGLWWATNATRQQRVGLAVVHFCPQCGRQCAGPSVAPSSGPDDQATMTFARGLTEAFAYPLRSSGVWMVLSGALALLLAQYAARLAGYAFLLCPMTLVGLALADSVAGLNPVVIVPSILRLFGQYCAAVMLAGVLLLVQLMSSWLAETLWIPFVSSLAVKFLSLYLLVVTARILGVTYYLHREALGWFR